MEFYQEETNKLRRMIVWLVDIIVVISLAWFVVYGFGIPDPHHGTVHDAGAKKRRRGVDEPFIL